MDMLVYMDLGKYSPYVVYKIVKKVLYIEVLKDIHGGIQPDMLSYINMINHFET